MSQRERTHSEMAERPLEKYHEMTATSRETYREACEYMPGGNTRGAVFYPPYPAYIESGSGCRVTDVDGNEYLDFVNNMTSQIHGHAPAEVVEAAKAAVDASSTPGGPTRAEVEFAKHLCARVPALEKVRFSNSGTEATMNALRAARAYTGNDVVAKFEGAYHGTNDDSQVSVHPPDHLAGPADDPNSVADSAGVPDSTLEDVLTLPYNDAESAVGTLEANRQNLAAIIMCPIMGSAVIPATAEFVAELAAFSDRHDVPLVFDEVISFRLAYGGAHTRYGVEPDLVTFGKLIGGGFPVGAFGGREELMAGYDPRGGSRITHSGTFNANPVTARAGLAALEAFDEAAVDRINDLGADLAAGARDVIADHGLPIRVNRKGSLFRLYLTDDPVETHRDAAAARSDLEHDIFMELLDEGVRIVPKLMGAVSTAMTGEEIDAFVEALDVALGRTADEFGLHHPVRD